MKKEEGEEKSLTDIQRAIDASASKNVLVYQNEFISVDNNYVKYV